MNFLESLSQDLQELFKDNVEYDVIIVIGEGPYEKSFRAHSNILRCRCPYLYSELNNNNDYFEENVRIIRKPQIASKEFYNDFISKHPGIISESNNFKKLNEKALVSIIKRDDLQLDESQIWDLVIGWGLAQNPTLPSDRKYWEDTDFSNLKKTLQNCIPHIRFFHIPSKKIFDDIRPYQKILQTQLWDDIWGKICVPERP
ncbi:11294_t:CDS:2, partial [Acaulospora morrowiae]